MKHCTSQKSFLLMFSFLYLHYYAFPFSHNGGHLCIIFKLDDEFSLLRSEEIYSFLDGMLPMFRPIR